MLEIQSTPIRSAIHLAAIAALLAILCATGLALVDIPIDALPFQLKNKDFANYWLSAMLARSGEALLMFGDATLYFERMKAIFGPDYPWHNWSYPPHAVLFFLPLGYMGYLPAMSLFLGLTLALYILALGTVPARATLIGAVLLIPFVVTNLVSTQNGFLTAALMLGGLMLRDTRPILSGILFGLLTFKPQLGLLLPPLLLYERQWRLIGTTILTATIMVMISVLVFGIDSWTGFVVNVLPQQTAIMKTFGGDFPHMMASAFGSARSLGFDAVIAMQIHWPIAAIGISLFVLGLFRLGNAYSRAFSLLFASFLIVPYTVVYDLGALCAFAALWPLGTGRQSPMPLRMLLILVAMLPIAMLPLGQAGLPVAPLLLLFAYVAMLGSEGVFSARSITDAAQNPARPSTSPPQ